jgi:nucleoside-diphosphate-sugar epimerase
MQNKIIINDLKEILFSKLVIWKKFSGNSFLISGGQGMLGKYIIYTLIYLNTILKKKIKIITIIRGNLHKDIKKFHKDKKIIVIKKDLKEIKKINYKIDYIIHAASNSDPKKYLKEPIDTLNTNYNGTLNLLSCCNSKKIKSFLYLSSGDIYGNVKKKEISETDVGSLDILTERSCYSESKRVGETLCYNFYLKYKLPIKIVRLFHTYGPTMNLKDGRIFAALVKNLKKKKKIILNSNGSEKRSFCYITDAIIGFFLILQKGKNGSAYNLANNKQNIKIINLAKIIVKIANDRISIITKKNYKYLHQTSFTNFYKPSIKKIGRLGWSPKVDVSDGFKRVIDYINY